jgi:uncharacterized protein YuzE
MNFNYDTIADAAYLKVNKGKVKQTVEMKNGVVVDLGEKGNIIGIEILNFSAQQSIKTLQESAKEGMPINITSGTPVLV